MPFKASFFCCSQKNRHFKWHVILALYKRKILNQNPIKLITPLAVAFYFFLGEVVAVFISAKFGVAGKFLTDIIGEHLAPKSFYFIGGIVLSISYIYSWYRKLYKPRNVKALNILIVEPANFVVTLGAVAVAVAWGEYFAMYLFADFPLIPQESYLPKILNGAIEITIQVVFLWCLLRVMYINTSELTNSEHITNAKWSFWIGMCLVSVFFISFWGTIGFNAFKYLGNGSNL